MKTRFHGALGLLFALGAATPVNGVVCSSTLLVEAAAYPSGGQPYGVAVADFNGDTLPDVASANVEGTVSVLLNNGDGILAAPIDSESNANGYALTAADLDGDDDVDLVAGTYSGISILLGDGNGGFADPVVYPVGNGLAHSIVVANFDAGDTPDLAVATEYAATVAVLLGDGNGDFNPAVNFPSGGAAFTVATADFDSNDIPDLVAANAQSNTVTLLLGFGNGTFAPPTSFVAGASPRYLVAADFDGDGDPDVAVTAGSYLSVLKGNGAGVLSAAHQYPADNSNALVLGDFTGDGNLDLGSLGNWSYGSRVDILAGDGEARFALLPSGFLGGPAAIDLASSDFDGDGRLDIVVSNLNSSTVSMLQGTGGGRFIAARSIDARTSAEAVASGDYDGDGILDLAVAGYDKLVVQLGDGTGGFVPSFQKAFGNSAAAVVSGDFTSDGIADLVVMSSYETIQFLEGRGDGTFEDPIPTGPLGYFLNDMAGGDFDLDGNLDLALTRGCCGSGFVTILPGHGNGTFGPPMDIATPHEDLAIVAGLFDADGALDLVVTSLVANEVLVLLNAGDGTFLAPVPYLTESVPQSVAAGDVTGDGVADLVTANTAAENLSLFAGMGDGTFAPAITLALGDPAVFIAAADLDGDGIDDLATANNTSPSSISVFIAEGNGKFATPQSYDTDFYPAVIVAGDFVLNGHNDLAVGISNAGTVNLFPNSQLGVAALPGTGACFGEAGVLHAFASGFGPVAYQWRKNGVDLVDGGHISGAATTTLRIEPAEAADEGDYDVFVTDLCLAVPSNTTAFSVSTPPATPVMAIEYHGAPGVPGLASVFATPGHTYVWSIGGDTDAIITEGQGTGVITYLAQSPGIVTLEVTEFINPGCGTASGVTVIPMDFFDVPAGHPFHTDIVRIARAGITAGCGSGNYCPGTPVTRAQMSVFLLKGLHGSDWIPDAVGDYFLDVPPGSFAHEWINYIAYQGITSGCGINLYCPANPVTRAQMAVFILKTLGVYYPPFSAQIFDDVPQGAFAWDFINEIYARGITGGCSASPLLYCPDASVNRGQMAAFISRAFLEPAP